MATIPEIARVMSLLLTTKADELALFHRFVRRRDKPLTGALFVQTLVLTLLGNPQPAVTDYCHTAAARGRPISAQGFDQNFTATAAELLLSILQLAAAVAIAATDPVAAGLLNRFSAVLLFDSSCIALPARLATLWQGCGAQSAPPAANAATLKLALGLELLRGQLLGFELLDGAVHDQLSRAPHAPLPPHALRLADLGFFNLARFAAVAAADGFWFSRLPTGTVLVTADGQRGEVDAVLAAHAGTAYDAWVEVGAEARLPARLIAVRVTQEVADNRRRQLRAAAAAKGRAVSARRLAGAGWNVYICNIPAEQLSVPEAVVLAGVRWQIEIVQSQITKPHLLTTPGGRDHVADLDLLPRHDHPVNQQLYQRPPRRKVGLRQPRLHAVAKLRDRCRQAHDFVLAFDLHQQVLGLLLQAYLPLLQLAPAPFVFLQLQHPRQIRLRQAFDLPRHLLCGVL